LVEDAWVKISEGALVCCDYDPESRRCFQSAAPSTWSGARFYRTLVSGVDSLAGTFDVVTNAVSSGASIGEPNTVASSISVNRSISH
jgi:hypothetical protein